MESLVSKQIAVICRTWMLLCLALERSARCIWRLARVFTGAGDLLRRGERTIIIKFLTHMNGVKVSYLRGAAILALLAVFLAACSLPAEEEPAAETERAAGEAEENIRLYKRFAGAGEAEMAHYVGAIDDNLFIGVAVSPEEAGSEEPRTVAVYLCDGQTVSQWLREEVSGQEATLIAGDTSVDVTIADNSVSGSVTLADGASRPFTADPATGDAGLYRAEWTLAGADYVVDWVVLADGRQRGGLDGKGNDVIVVDPN